jgi:multisubunit Na+/H+ antiporter MnhB subunit
MIFNTLKKYNNLDNIIYLLILIFTSYTLIYLYFYNKNDVIKRYYYKNNKKYYKLFNLLIIIIKLFFIFSIRYIIFYLKKN